MTPPVGVAMYTVCSLLDCPIEEYIVESIPFVLAVVGLVAVMLLWPGLVLFMPNALM
ncbi:TRAP transporter large permease subunit [Acinetobacter baumannii]